MAGTCCVFGQRLGFLRRYRKMNVQQLSRKSGIKNAAISKLEKGQTMPSTNTVLVLCESLKTHPDFLLGYSKQPEVFTYADKISELLSKLPPTEQKRALKQVELIKAIFEENENGGEPKPVVNIDNIHLYM